MNTFTVSYAIDPNISSTTNVIWSAWITMTHIGFGDIVPTSLLGRLLSALLILFALAVFSLFTAILSASLIAKNINIWEHDVRQIKKEITHIEADEKNS